MDDTEVAQMNQQTDRYQENVDVSKADIQTVDPLEILYALEERFNDASSQLALCTREPVCRCKTRDCLCDSDEFVNIESVKMDLASNCVFICEFRGETFAFLKHKSLGKKTLRVFSMTRDGPDNAEYVLMDVMRCGTGSSGGTVKLHYPSSCSFDLADDVLIGDRSLLVKLNYMSCTVSSKVSS